MTEIIGNHLWQSTLFAVVAALLALLLRNNHARVRYGLWLAASLKFLVPFSLFISIGSSIGLNWPHSAPVPQEAIAYIEGISRPFDTSADASGMPAKTESDRIPWISILLPVIWLCGFLAVLFHYLAEGRRVAALLRHAQSIQDGRAHEALHSIDISDRLKRRIRLASSDSSMEPGIFGIFTPILILPEGLLDHLTHSELEAILAHEIVHVRRHDNFFAATHMLVESLFWFHPMVWWLGAKLVQERERACDEEVLKLGKDPQSYAEGILKVCEFYLASPLKCVSGVTGADMKKRIQAIMTRHIGGGLSLAKKLMLTAAAFAALALPVGIGLLQAPASRAQSQTEPKPSFEVASVKPAADCGYEVSNRPGMKMKFAGGPSFQPGGRYSTCNALRNIINEAYGIEFYPQLDGFPDWINNTSYKIEAKAEGNPDRDQMRLMLQSLLEERFNLKMHREMRETPIYALVVAKGGPKLQPAKDEQGNPIASTPSPERSNEKLAEEIQKAMASGKPLTFKSPGSFAVMITPGNQARLTATAVSMERFARQLSTVAGGRKVVDRTGLGGLFDIQVLYTMDAQMGPRLIQVNPPPGGDSPAPAAEASGPTLFTALQEQLGLKLEADKGPLEYFVVDGVEKPKEN